MPSTASRGRRPGKKFRPNYLYAVISVAMVLFMAGLFALLVLHGKAAVRLFKEQVTILVEIKPEARESQIDSLHQKLERAKYIKPGSLEFISKEQALQELQEDFEEVVQMDLPNPLYDLFQFNLKAGFFQQDTLRVIKTHLEKEATVSEVYYQENLIEGLTRNVQNFGWAALLISLLLLIVAITLIHNTMRLALYANRFTLKNMQLVGASWGYITRPFLIRSVGFGALSGLIAVGALIALLLHYYSSMPELKGILPNATLILLFLALMVLGILINLASTWITIRNYLSLRADDLY